MFRNNLHISMTDFRSESRVLKETQSLVLCGVFDRVHIAALHDSDLPTIQALDGQRTVVRFRLWSRGLSRSLVTQLIKYLEWFWRIFIRYRKEHIVAINIHTLGLLPMGVALKLLFRAALIYDTHELETEVYAGEGIRKSLAKMVEKRLIGFCDHVFVVSHSIAEWYEREYSMRRPTVLLNAPRLRTEARQNRFRASFPIAESERIFLYQGGLVRGRGIEAILKCFVDRRPDNSVVVFMGQGEMVPEIEAATAIASNIFYHPAVPPEDVLVYTASADVGVHIIPNTTLNHYFCMPNKLFEYAMAGLPVIVSPMKEMSTFVNQYEMGLVLDEESVEALAAAVHRIGSMDLERMRLNAIRAAQDNCWEIQEEKLLAAYNLIGGKK